MHFGSWWIQPGIFYQAKGNQIRNGLVAVEFLLTDQPQDGGGFCFIPSLLPLGAFDLIAS